MDCKSKITKNSITKAKNEADPVKLKQLYTWQFALRKRNMKLTERRRRSSVLLRGIENASTQLRVATNGSLTR